MKTANERRVAERRQLIFRHVVLDNHPLRLQQVRDYLKIGYDEDKAQTDIDAFAAVACFLQLQPSRTDPNDKEIVFLEGPHTDDDTVRETINVKEKQLVAHLAASLICSVQEDVQDSEVPPWMQETSAKRALEELFARLNDERHTVKKVVALLETLKNDTQKQDDGVHLASTKEILKLLAHCNPMLGRQCENLKRRLFTFWAETSRLVAIDSGTTNIHLSRFLNKTHIPLIGSRLCSLTVCTNSRRIFEILGPSHVWVKSIVVGGQQMFRTPTIAGEMAENFLRSASIQFGMCILGATRVDLDRYEVCSDSQEESSLKNLFMDRSSLRVICVDHSKLQSGPGRTGYRYASIDPRHIDLVLTNCPMARKTEAAKETYRTFMDNVEKIENRGIPVMVATSRDTFPYPSNV